jgi:hypothetical protein
MYRHDPYTVHVIRLSLNIDRKQCESVAQVISFCLHILVPVRGLEPRTHALSRRCSTPELNRLKLVPDYTAPGDG